MTRSLVALPLTAERFAPFGDVIEARNQNRQAMNEARFERFNDLAGIDLDGGRPCLSIVRCRTPTALPYRVDMLERHPNGSQAFVPLSGFSFLIVVAPPAQSVDVDDVVALVSNGHQGINYRKGVWHMPMIALERGQQFLVIDRSAAGCDEFFLDPPIMVST